MPIRSDLKEKSWNRKKCPNCKGKILYVIEKIAIFGVMEIMEDGSIGCKDLSDPNPTNDPLEAICGDCEYRWTMRGSNQIELLID